MGLKCSTTFAVLVFIQVFVSVGNCSGEGALATGHLTIWSINPNTPFGDLTDRFARQFSAENAGFILNSVHFPNDYYKTALRTAMQNRGTPDIFHNWGESSLRPYVLEDKVLALDFTGEQLRKPFLPVAFEPVTMGGKTYGVPYSGLTGVFFWYRKDLFDKFELAPPKTWREFLEVGEILKKNGIVPLALANKNKWPGSLYYMYLVDRIGGHAVFRDAMAGRNGGSFTNPAFVQAGELIQDLVRRGFFPEGFNRMQDEPGTWNSLIISGKAGMYLMGSWFLNALDKLPSEMKEKFDFFGFPTVGGGKGNPDDLVGSPGQDYLAVSASCRHPDAAVKFLSEYVGSESYFRELAKLGVVPPVQNAETYLADPVARKVARAFQAAEHVQIYYDVVMTPTMAEIHKLLVHQLFELRLSPEQVARNHRDVILSEFDRR